MVVWSDVILYGFLVYLFIHLVLEDLVFVYNSLYRHASTSRSKTLSPYAVAAEEELEFISTSRPVNGIPSVSSQLCQDPIQFSIFQQRQQQYIVSAQKNTDELMHVHSRRSSLIILFSKLCDVVLACVMGYFHTFNTCWCASLDCLNKLITRYIDFLEVLTKTLTAYPTIVFTSVTTVLVLSIVCVMLAIVVPPRL